MTKYSRVIAHVVAFGISFGAVAALAQQPARQAPQPASPRTSAQPADARESTDNAFVRKAAAGGHAEVELATLAMQKSLSDAVKQLAQRIESDHKKANAELMTIAKSKNIDMSVDPTPMPEQMKTKARLEKLSGAQFDRAYLDTMVKDHQKTIKEFERQASAGTDAELKGFASKTLPDLKEHLKMTMDAQKAMTSTQQ